MPLKIVSPQPSNIKPRNMCDGCDIRCCTLSVSLTTYDILRIVMSKEILVADFVEFKLTFPDDPYALRLNNFFYKMILKRRGGICTFIRANQSLRCGIEELKPAICLAYPLRLKEGKPTIRADAICPAQNKARVDMAKMSAQILSDCDWELATYKEIVRDWNVKANSNSGFEEFMLFASHEMDLEATPWGSVYRKIKRSIFSRR